MSGEKRYEFRKTIFRDRNVERAYIYCTAPVKRIVGTFMIGDIYEASPKRLWADFKTFSGLSDTEFFDYFDGRMKGFAIEIGFVERFDTAIDPMDVDPGFVPPQSFRYIDNPLTFN